MAIKIMRCFKKKVENKFQYILIEKEYLLHLQESSFIYFGYVTTNNGMDSSSKVKIMKYLNKKK